MCKHTNRQIDKQFWYKNSPKSRIGFTLVEVVVAVAIIGTLATLTINTYFTDSNSQKNQYVAGLKKVYAELSYATDQIKSSNSGTLVGAFTSSIDALNNFGNTFKVSKICTTGAVRNTSSTSFDGCWIFSTNNLHGDAAIATGSLAVGTGFAPNTDYTGAVLSDGTTLLFYISNPACNGTGVSLNLPYSSSIQTFMCGYIVADVNGFKGPNTFGRDMFMFLLGSNGLYTGGDSHTLFNNQAVDCSITDTTHNGYGCAARVLRDGRMMY